MSGGEKKVIRNPVLIHYILYKLYYHLYNCIIVTGFCNYLLTIQLDKNDQLYILIIIFGHISWISSWLLSEGLSSCSRRPRGTCCIFFASRIRWCTLWASWDPLCSISITTFIQSSITIHSFKLRAICSLRYTYYYIFYF